MPKRPQRPRTGKVEREYGRALRKIARHVADIVGGFPLGDPAADPLIRRALDSYAAILDGWARHTAKRMLEGVVREDDAAWRARSLEMSAALADEIRNAPTGATMRQLLEEQVDLIKSIPLKAAERVHKWTLIGIEDATRAKEVAAEIGRTNDVTAARAMLIARTEVARTASKLTEARAKYIGSEGYIWRSARDSDVRDSHREMEGKFVPWHTPPTLSDGTVTHAGQIYNCRCYAEPVIPN